MSIIAYIFIIGQGIGNESGYVHHTLYTDDVDEELSRNLAMSITVYILVILIRNCKGIQLCPS